MTSVRHVYVHVPFCARRCSYCDFAIAVRREVPVRGYLAALERELEIVAPPGQAATALETLYLGGGTPSLLGPGGVAELLALLQGRFHRAPGAEITLEANPEDVTPVAVAAWRRAGVTRISLGVQSFHPAVLSWMHRVHTAEAARAAARLVAAGGFDSWSLDLIFALPDEVPRDWMADLREAAALEPPHLSVYGLAVEPHTPLARWVARGALHDPSDVRYEEEFLLAHDLLEQAGYAHYEVSNYARDGHAARHNSAYWRHVPYLGIGPSAHSYDGSERRWNEREFRAWMERALAGSDPTAGREVLSREQRRIEQLYLGLRTASGLQADALAPEIVENWQRQGWAARHGTRLALTAQGWLRLDALVAALTVSSTPC